MVYLAYSKPNKCGRNEMSAEGIRLLRRLLESAGERSDVELAREPNGRPYIIGRKVKNHLTNYNTQPQNFLTPKLSLMLNLFYY